MVLLMLYRQILQFMKKILPSGIVQSLQKIRAIVYYVRINYAAKKQRHYKTPWVCVLPYDPNESVRYLNEVYSDYFTYSGIPVAFIKGKRILEIGPGENLGIGMRFLADGAAFVASVDRFCSLRSSGEQIAVYQQVFDSFDDTQRSAFGDTVVFTSDGYKLNESRYRYIANTAIEEVSKKHSLEKFDMIVSRAVLEHVADVDGAFTSMHSLLRPEGSMRLTLEIMVFFPSPD
jgi:SAM-dependent methyltransferase